MANNPDKELFAFLNDIISYRMHLASVFDILNDILTLGLP